MFIDGEIVVGTAGAATVRRTVVICELGEFVTLAVWSAAAVA